MEITLTLDEELVERARVYAAHQGRTLDDLVAEHLRQYSAPALAADWEQFTREHAGCSEPGWRFSREAASNRPEMA